MSSHRGQRTPPRSAWRQGLRDAAPFVLGYLPFTLVLGTTINATPVPALLGWATSPLLFAGASQLALLDLLGAGVPAGIVVATVGVINARHVMYSGALAPWFRDAPLWWRLFAPHVLADPVYSLAALRFPQLPTDRERRVYYATFSLVLLTVWTIMTAAGMVVGATLPAFVNLELAVPLVFLALLAPNVSDRPTAAAAVVGGAVTVAAQGLPLRLGLIVGALSGVAAGLLADLAEARRKQLR